MKVKNSLEDTYRHIRLLVRQLETRHCIIAGFDIEHHLVKTGTHPAWSMGNQIYFNAAKLPVPDTADTIAEVTGVGYHELAHTLFTPTITDMQRVWPAMYPATNPMIEGIRTNPLYANAFNALEDQRIETLLLRRYRRMKPYLIKMFLSVVMAGATEESYATLYTLVRGRRYLSKRYRRMVRKRFAKQAVVKDLARIIDAFCTLNLTRRQGMEDAHQLILDYMKLMEDAGLSAPTAHMHCKAADTASGQSRQMAQDAQKIDQEAAAVKAEIKAENAKDDEAANDQAPDGSGGDDGLGDADGAGGADSDGKPGKGDKGQSGKGDGSEGANGAAQGAGSGQGSGDSGYGNGAGTGGSAATPVNPTVADLQAEAAAQAAAAAEHPDVKADSADVRRVMKQASELSSSIQRQAKWSTTVPDELRGVANRIAKELQRLEVDTDPYWDRRVNSGRLNVQRVMLGETDTEQMFDRWQEGGMGGNDQEWVVLLDQSASMRDRFPELSRAAWAMKRAADKMGAKMTILGYGSQHNRTCIYDGNQTAKTNSFPVLDSLGDTEPLNAIIEAQAVLYNSTRAIRGLLTMTDGYWGGFRSTHIAGQKVTDDGLIARMAKDGVVTCLTYMQSSRSTYGKGNKHGAQLYEEINTAMELPHIMRRLIASQMKVAQR